MMKQKTNKTATKRFKVTAGGKLLHFHAYSSHLKTKKTNRRIRQQHEPKTIFHGLKKTVQRLLGV